MGMAKTMLTTAKTTGLKSDSAVAIVILGDEIYINILPSIERYKSAKNWGALTDDFVIVCHLF